MTNAKNPTVIQATRLIYVQPINNGKANNENKQKESCRRNDKMNLKTLRQDIFAKWETVKQQTVEDIDQKIIEYETQTKNLYNTIDNLNRNILRQERWAKNLHILGDHYQAQLNEDIIKALTKNRDENQQQAQSYEVKIKMLKTTRKVFQRVEQESNFQSDEKGVVYYK